MSAQQSFEIASDNHTVAVAIDTDFQLIADAMPIHIKRDAYAGEEFLVTTVDIEQDLGRDISQPNAPQRYVTGYELKARYIGHSFREASDHRLSERRLLELMVKAQGDNVTEVAFWKEYEVGYGWNLYDTAPTTAEEFEGCPVPPTLIAFMVGTVRQALQASQDIRPAIGKSAI